MLETGGLFSGVDPRALAGYAAVAAVFFGLIAWQARGNPANCRSWLGLSALSLEALAAAMALSWAVFQGEGIFTLVFAVCFIGLTLAKAVTAGALVHSYRTGNTAAVWTGVIVVVGVYSVVYLAGVLGGVNDTANKTAAAAATSAPIQAIDAQLADARAQLAGLSGYADADRAQSESESARQEAQLASDTRTKLMGDLAAARGELSACPKDHITRCIKPANAKIERLRAEIAALPTVLSSKYAENHAAYEGVKTHIESLEAQRAQMLSGAGAATVSATGADDRLVGWVFGGLQGEQAAGLKWLLFVLAFDVLSLLLRVFSELHGGSNDAQKTASIAYSALLRAGVSPVEAAEIIARNQQAQPARQTDPVAAEGKGIVQRFAYSLGEGFGDVAARQVPVRFAPPAQKAGNRQAANPEISDPCYRARALEIIAPAWSANKDISQNKCRELLRDGKISMNTMALNKLIKSVLDELRSGENA